jgi:hypothetical protein
MVTAAAPLIRRFVGQDAKRISEWVRSKGQELEVVAFPQINMGELKILKAPDGG